MKNIPKMLEDTGKWSKKTALLSKRAGHKCEYCGLDFFESVRNYKSFQLDHIIPLSKGGKDTKDNIAVACKTCNVNLKSRWNPADKCNSRKRDDLIKKVREYIKERENDCFKEIAMMRDIVYGQTHN